MVIFVMLFVVVVVDAMVIVIVVVFGGGMIVLFLTRGCSVVSEFGSNSDDSNTIDVCGVERLAHSKEVPSKSPIINSSVNCKGMDLCPRH